MLEYCISGIQYRGLIAMCKQTFLHCSWIKQLDFHLNNDYFKKQYKLEMAFGS